MFFVAVVAGGPGITGVQAMLLPQQKCDFGMAIKTFRAPYLCSAFMTEGAIGDSFKRFMPAGKRTWGYLSMGCCSYCEEQSQKQSGLFQNIHVYPSQRATPM